MSTALAFSMNILLLLIEISALYLLSSCFFKSKCQGLRLCFCWATLFFLNVVILILAQGQLTVKVLILTALDAAWIKYVFRENIIKCTVVSVLFFAFMLAGDSFFLTGLGIFLHRDISSYLQNPYGYYLFCYIAKILELFVIMVLRHGVRARTSFQSATWVDWLRVISFPALSAIISVILAQLYTLEPAFAPQILFCSVVLVLTDLMAILLLNYLDKQRQALHDYAILKHSMKLDQDNVQAWMNAYSNQRKQTHEFQNQLSVIYGLAQQEPANGELVRYVAQLLQTDLSESLFVKTGRTVVDVVLNQKHAVAQSKGITLNVQLDDLSHFALPDDALVVVLSNLIDNAIEACEKNQDPRHKTIRLNMDADPAANFLYIENPAEKPVKIVNNHIVTSKKGTAEHGYGLKNISAILSQYDTEFALDYQEETNMFRFSLQVIPPEK